MFWGGVASVLGRTSRQPTLVGNCHKSTVSTKYSSYLSLLAVDSRTEKHFSTDLTLSHHISPTSNHTVTGNKHSQDSAFLVSSQSCYYVLTEKIWITTNIICILQTLICQCHCLSCCTVDTFSSENFSKSTVTIWCYNIKYKTFLSKHFSLLYYFVNFSSKNICFVSTMKIKKWSPCLVWGTFSYLVR